MARSLAAERQARLRSELAQSPFDVVVIASPANVTYATGYRSAAADIYPRHQMAALVSAERCLVVAPCGEAVAALTAGIDPADYVPYGTAYFESPGCAHPITAMAGQHDTFAEAIQFAVQHLGAAHARVGVDERALEPSACGALEAALGTRQVAPASAWLFGVRAIKLPGEVACLRRAAELADQGIQRALQQARPGWTERQIAGVIAQTMIEGGGEPRFLSVHVGPRIAQSDAYPGDAAWQPGDLLRMDVGCTVEGYWSDMARTAVLGSPDPVQKQRFDALLAGQQAELDAIRPGITPGSLFDLAIQTTCQSGLPGYRRHHCGHSIGLEIYEPPQVAPGVDTPIAEGMVFCLETPFYEIGWGGILTEDTVVVTATGQDAFTRSSRELRVVPT